MIVRVLIFVGCAALAAFFLEPAGAQQNPAAPGPTAVAALLDTYCVTCHNDKAQTGGLSLQHVSLTDIPKDAETWEKVVRKVRAGMMPPPGMPRPDSKSALDGLAAFLETALDRAAAANPKPGRATMHRLNRAEYANAIRDLLAVDVDAAVILPPDDESSGFDNIADVLKVPPSLMERYLSASWNISRTAVGNPGIAAVTSIYRVRPDLSQDQHLDGMPLGTRGGILAHHAFPLDGEYTIKVRLWRNTFDLMRGMEDPHEIEIAMDGVRLQLVTAGGREDFLKMAENPGTFGSDLDRRLTVRIPVKAGTHSISATTILKSHATRDDLIKPFMRTSIDGLDIMGDPSVDRLTIEGPFGQSGSGDTESRRKIFVCTPKRPDGVGGPSDRPSKEAGAAGVPPVGRAVGPTLNGVGGPSDRPSKEAGAAGVPPVGRAVGPTLNDDEPACAAKILSRLARLAYRKPVDNATLETLMGFYRAGRSNNGSFESGIESALQFILASPEFLFRFELDPPGVASNAVYRLSDLALASRLSFFLWSSIPDDQLLTLATQGKLKDPAVLEQQVKRMLADRRSEALITNFAEQWLHLRNLKNAIPDLEAFPDFDDNLRQAMKEETTLFFDSIMREDRSVVDLLDADYTFVNERLARHYGIPNVYGSPFRRVKVTNEARRGLLGQASILTVTSYPNRTSPVERGKWILTNLLGVPPSPPPPNVPPLKDDSDDGKPLSLRERMERHRKDPTCAGCHRVMDPIGFALENFDAVGHWRTSDGGTKIDPSGTLFNGASVDGAVALRRTLVSRPETFVGVMTEKMLTYALGRGLEHYDMPAVRKTVQDARSNNFRFSSMVLGIVKSTPFQLKEAK